MKNLTREDGKGGFRAAESGEVQRPSVVAGGEFSIMSAEEIEKRKSSLERDQVCLVAEIARIEDSSEGEVLKASKVPNLEEILRDEERVVVGEEMDGTKCGNGGGELADQNTAEKTASCFEEIDLEGQQEGCQDCSQQESNNSKQIRPPGASRGIATVSEASSGKADFNGSPEGHGSNASFTDGEDTDIEDLQQGHDSSPESISNGCILGNAKNGVYESRPRNDSESSAGFEAAAEHDSQGYPAPVLEVTCEEAYVATVSARDRRVSRTSLDTKSEDLALEGDRLDHVEPEIRRKSATIPRTSTDTSLAQSDAQSFTSISSLSTELSTSASISDTSRSSSLVVDTEDAGFTDISLQGKTIFHERKSSISSTGSSCLDDSTAVVQGAKPKRRGLGMFLSKNLFSRKSSGKTSSEPSLGWRLFRSKQAAHKEASKAAQDVRSKSASPSPKSTVRRKSTDFIVGSTTALILENRPTNLPPKSAEEEQKHREQYEAMVEEAKRREKKDIKQKMMQLQQQIKHENTVASAMEVWNSEILNNWDMMKQSRKAQELWWQGLPPSIRGKVWKLAIGNDLNITYELYEIFRARAKDRIKLLCESGPESDEDASPADWDREDSVELIKLDISRTFPHLCIFQKGGPYHDMLHGVLGAYVCYRPDVGYVQGMSFLAAVLILNMEPADAFVCFSNLLNKPCQLAFFRVDSGQMKIYFDTYEVFFEENLPKLYTLFQKWKVTPDLYLIDWIFTLYSKSLPLDVASRVWDVFCRDGEEFLFRTALGILLHYEDILVNMDFIQIVQFLTKLPEVISDDKLFQSIAAITMQAKNKKFKEVLSSVKEGVASQNSDREKGE
ncbi:TBC1 domain family member 14-like isoform X2 [Branchiostoma lanceolatum]|uniref:TBC1 domain family member 14-like isoform X2 n=1 Tax=Branchiostoma lanceolatum TaxID=7740 RepID=UPI003453A3DD